MKAGKFISFSKFQRTLKFQILYYNTNRNEFHFIFKMSQTKLECIIKELKFLRDFETNERVRFRNDKSIDTQYKYYDPTDSMFFSYLYRVKQAYLRLFYGDSGKSTLYRIQFLLKESTELLNELSDEEAKSLFKLWTGNNPLYLAPGIQNVINTSLANEVQLANKSLRDVYARECANHTIELYFETFKNTFDAKFSI